MVKASDKKVRRDEERDAVLSLVADRLAGFRARHRPLEPEVIDALLLAEADEACRKIGDTTRSPVVLAAALRWAEKIDAGLSDRRYGEMPIGPEAFSYFVTLIERLDRVMRNGPADADAERRASLRALREAELHAEGVRRGVLDAMLSAMGKNEAWLEALDDTQAVSKAIEADSAVARLRSLAAWLEAVIAQPSRDPSLGAVFRVRRIGAAEVTALLSAADQLARAQKARPVGAQSAHDAPEVNIAEGRLIYEMRRLRLACAAARRAGRTTLVLAPPKPLFRVFGLGEGEDSDEEVDPAPAA